MGTETILYRDNDKEELYQAVKLNNPLMGTETRFLILTIPQIP